MNNFDLRKYLAESRLLKESPSYLFMDGDNQLELDKDEFQKYILGNINKIKSLWGGTWDESNIEEIDIKKAIELFWENFLNDISSNIDSSSNDPFNEYLRTFDEEDENVLLVRFLTYLNDVINI